MTAIATVLQDRFILRSGGADGADSAFERGVTNGRKEIYLPWRKFNKNLSPLHTVGEDALSMAGMYHPVWKRLTRPAQLLHARNCYQVLGADLKSPARFVLCWTPDGCESFAERTVNTGGTGMAITIASYNDIPVINMFNERWEDSLDKLL